MSARSLQPFLDAISILRDARNMSFAEATVFLTVAEHSGDITLPDLADAAAVSEEEANRILRDLGEQGGPSGAAPLFTTSASLVAGGEPELALSPDGERLYARIVATLSGETAQDGPTER